MNFTEWKNELIELGKKEGLNLEKDLDEQVFIIIYSPNKLLTMALEECKKTLIRHAAIKKEYGNSFFRFLNDF